MLGHRRHSLLNGGFAAWDDLELPVADAPAPPTPTSYRASVTGEGVIDIEGVLSGIGNDGVLLLDVRSAPEYRGDDRRAHRGGHIPGAVHFEWSEAIDLLDNGRLRSRRELLARLEAIGVTPNKAIVPYCQTHHRSSHTYVLLKHLGFPDVRAYAGSWSEWGNAQDVPVETGRLE